MFKPLFIFIFSFLSQQVLAADIKEWTFLTFLNGHNNLDSFGDMNMKQMKEVGSSDQINVVVQWASLKNKNTKRIYVKKGEYDIVQDMPAVDMGDYRNLIDFVKWAHENYPAKKYFVNVWNHGSGWHLKNKSGIVIQDISNDDLTGNKITTEQLGLAMKEIAIITGGAVEIYGSDACLMGMAEVASQMKGVVNFFAGSEELEPAEGWPYNLFLTRWMQNPYANGAEVGKILAEEYFKAYSGGIYGRKEVTFSILDLSKLASFESAMAGLADEFKNLTTPELKSLKTAARKTQTFGFDDYKDIYDFAQIVENQQNLARFKSSITRVKEEVQKLVIANYASEAEYSKSYGIAIWMPTFGFQWANYGERYLNLDFHKETQWGEVAQRLSR